MQSWVQPRKHPLGDCFCLRNVIQQQLQAFVRPTKGPNLGGSLYSKIHFLAAALNFSSPAWLVASE